MNQPPTPSWGQPNPGPAPQGTPVPPRKKSWLKWLIILPLLTLGSCSVGMTMGSSSTASAPAPTSTVTVTAPADGEPAPTVTVTAEAEPAPTVTVTADPPAEEVAPEGETIGEGTWLVGEEVQAGRYVTEGPEDVGCYWQRASDDSGEFEAIIANGNEDGRGSVTIEDGEYFTSNGCQPWVKQ